LAGPGRPAGAELRYRGDKSLVLRTWIASSGRASQQGAKEPQAQNLLELSRADPNLDGPGRLAREELR